MRSGAGVATSNAAPRRHSLSVSASQRHKTADGVATKPTRMLDDCRALVLDGAFRPLAVVSWHKAVTLDVFKSVEVLEYYDCCVKTVREDYPVPAVLRSEFVMKGVHQQFRVALSRKNVMKRDKHCCVYCGSEQALSIDHIVPLSRGGESTWENMVTACKDCNCKKGDRSLEQLGWKLRTLPKQPACFDLHFRIDLPLPSPKEWEDYIGHLTQESEYTYL